MPTIPATSSGSPGATTADVYISGGAARSTANRISLMPAFVQGCQGQSLTGGTLPIPFTHMAIFAADVDIRDAYNEGAIGTGDVVYVPQNAAGTPFRVVFVERVAKGTTSDHKRVYLNRQTAPWPTNDL